MELVQETRNNTWGGWLALIFLILCLAAGLLIAELWAPQPVIGVVRFADVIWYDTAENLIDVIEAARQDERVAGVVLEISSPGGLSTSSEKLFYTLLKLRDTKPLVVVIDEIAASGGYYLAVAGNRIYASPSSFIGNVGVRGPRPYDPLILPSELNTGPYKLTGGDRFDQIRQLDLLKEAFVGNVVHQRELATLNPLKIDAQTVAEGRLYVGSEALGAGLIDAEGSRSDAVLAAAELAGLHEYGVADLLDYFGFGFTLEYQEPVFNVAEAVAQRLATAPADALFFLDSRIALTDLLRPTALERHLLQLRAAAPGPFQAPRQPLRSYERSAAPAPSRE
jgi:protease-4